MAIIEIDGKKITFGDDGFLADPGSWTEELAGLIARHDGIEELTEKHWVIIRFIRKSWEEDSSVPAVRSMCKEFGIRLKELYELFPLGPTKGVYRIAGIPKPEGCM